MPLRGIVQCWCGRKMTAGWSKGKKKHYVYYICSQYRNLSIPGKKLHSQLMAILSLLNFSKDQTDYLGQIARSKLKEALENRKQGLIAKNKDLQETEKKIDRLESKLLEGEIESETYKNGTPDTWKKKELLNGKFTD